MSAIIMNLVPTSMLFLGIIFFSGLMFKIATQNVRFKKRSKEFLLKQFLISLIFVIIFFPVAVIMSQSQNLFGNFLIRAVAVAIVDVAVLSCWHSFLAALRAYPKTEETPPVQAPATTQENPSA